ncbi:Response regulator mcs4 [Pseudocercospora fuligena]|uniref:Response regulator mcs4 n=1 Tax=Pseudocercospora fuligena TaxID=685502 RepID=A0A8H6VNF8_9PEZI|nr:Response regulator mcs4 [Pseudocercospora fuligena]
MPRWSLRPILRRLSSKHSNTAESTQSDGSDTTAATSASPSPSPQPLPRKSSSLAKLREHFRAHAAVIPELPPELSQRAASIASAGVPESEAEKGLVQSAFSDHKARRSTSFSQTLGDSESRLEKLEEEELPSPHQPAIAVPELKLDVDDLPPVNPRLVVEEPTPEALSNRAPGFQNPDSDQRRASGEVSLLVQNNSTSRPASSRGSLRSIISEPAENRRQSIVGSANATIVKALIDTPRRSERQPVSAPEGVLPTSARRDYFSSSIPDMATVLRRKIWVKRPNQSATLVQIQEDDLVDDVRDMILRKYQNSLGKTFDSPDLTLTIVTRSDHAGPRCSRMLGPEEEMCRTIDTYYPGGQTVEEALIIDLPQKRTPRPSPRAVPHQSYLAMDDFRPHENGTDYFPPMPVTIQPALPPNTREHHNSVAGQDHPRSISVLNTGHVPALPSPGGRARGHRAEREHRPKYGRQHTSSPTILSHGATANPAAAAPAITGAHLPLRTAGRPRVDSSASEAHHPNGVPAAPPLPTPPAPDAPPTGKNTSSPPTPNGTVPPAHGHRSARPRKVRKPTPDKPQSRKQSPLQIDPYNPNKELPSISTVLDSSVPPINVLIVEDNIINLRILEGLMKRLKVRWQTAMNGQIAVDKYKAGGFHLVLMDIQMPVMNGLQATKEIRRLERVNGIGVFSSTPGTPSENGPDGTGNPMTDKAKRNPEDDKLSMSEGLFKSPVIIVALTASSLQSDRHEALAAGCNDFLTKPVNFVWLERKVKEWGCMQALIDFDGWRKWKDYAAKEEENKTDEQKQKEREQAEKQKIKMEKMAKLQEKQRQKKEDEAKEKERKKRESMSSEAQSPAPVTDPAKDAPVIAA